MRFRLPPFPIVVHVRIEREPWRWPRPRFSVRMLAMTIAFVAVLMGVYVAMVEMPERRLRRQRFDAADRSIVRQVAELEGAAVLAIASDQEAENRLGLDLESMEAEKARAAGFPAGSEGRDLHTLLASQWRDVAARVRNRLGIGHEVAKELRAWAAGIRNRRGLVAGDLAAIEKLAFDADKYPRSGPWKRLKLASRFEDLKATMRSTSGLPGPLGP